MRDIMGHISIWNQAAADIKVEFWVGNKEVNETVLGANGTYDLDLGDKGHVVFSNHLAVFSTPQHEGIDVPKEGSIGVRVHGWNESIWIEQV